MSNLQTPPLSRPEKVLQTSMMSLFLFFRLRSLTTGLLEQTEKENVSILISSPTPRLRKGLTGSPSVEAIFDVNVSVEEVDEYDHIRSWTSSRGQRLHIKKFIPVLCSGF